MSCHIRFNFVSFGTGWYVCWPSDHACFPFVLSTQIVMCVNLIEQHCPTVSKLHCSQRSKAEKRRDKRIRANLSFPSACSFLTCKHDVLHMVIGYSGSNQVILVNIIWSGFTFILCFWLQANKWKYFCVETTGAFYNRLISEHATQGKQQWESETYEEVRMWLSRSVVSEQ